MTKKQNAQQTLFSEEEVRRLVETDRKAWEMRYTVTLLDGNILTLTHAIARALHRPLLPSTNPSGPSSVR